LKRATSLEDLHVELSEQVSYTAHQEFVARVLMFIADNLGDLDRLSKLEQRMGELHALLQTVRREAQESADETRQIVFEQMPKIKDGALVFEADDQQGNTVDCHVAIVKTDQPSPAVN
jgi:hypothetical protein